MTTVVGFESLLNFPVAHFLHMVIYWVTWKEGLKPIQTIR